MGIPVCGRTSRSRGPAMHRVFILVSKLELETDGVDGTNLTNAMSRCLASFTIGRVCRQGLAGRLMLGGLLAILVLLARL